MLQKMTELTKKQRVLDYVKAHTVVCPDEIKRQGLPGSYLYQLFREGKLERVGRGLYRWPGSDIGQHFGLVTAAKKAPRGVVVLLSALAFHGLTTQNPHSVWLAIDRKGRRPRIPYPPIRFVTMSKDLLQKGVQCYRIDGAEVRVTTPARTVADLFKYRGKVGIDVALEGLREGWKARQFTIRELMASADLCRVRTVMAPYVEALVEGG